MNCVDISRGLISENDVRKNLQIIFPDSIILKGHFTVVAVSASIIDTLGYPEHDLLNQSIEMLSVDRSITTLIEKELSKGCFEDVVASIKSSHGTITCKLSGFYLGLISDINDIAILKIKVVDSVNLTKQLEISRNELDEFVYRTTHDLRGPLATMRGLINLMKMEPEPVSDSMKYLIQLLDSHAETLDNRLFNLNYLSQTTTIQSVSNQLNCEDLESTLRSTIEENLPINCIDFKFRTSVQAIKVVNTQLTTSLLNHLLLYLLNLPKGSDAKLVYSLEDQPKEIKIVISCEGFLSNYQLRQALSHKDPLFTTIILYSDLINFFAAMKNAQRMGATIKIDSIYEKSQEICVLVPKSGSH